MTTTEIVPTDPTTTTPDQVHDLEQRALIELPLIDDAAPLIDWLPAAAALETYLAGKEGHAAAQGLARHLEARIGQLIGPAPGRGSSEMNTHGYAFTTRVRGEFRDLADALDQDHLNWNEREQWWASRRHLVAYTRGEALRPDITALKGSVTVEWYTPAEYIESARQVLGQIDLDPATSPLANETVKATTIYTEHDDGLTQDWPGTIWLNPPYGKWTGLFVSKLIAEHTAGRTTSAILLINAYGFDASWFQPLWSHTLCFTNHRIIFTSPQRGTGGPANGNLFAYLGPNPDRFAEIFAQHGTIARRWPA